VETFPAPPYYGVDWDNALEQTPLAVEAVLLGEYGVDFWLATNAPVSVLNLHVAEDMHREIFGGVFPEFAGRLRGPAPRYLPVNLHFGRFRGEPYETTPDACVNLFDTVAGLIRQLDDLRATLDQEAFDRETLKAASYTHCELVRIHPFRNGNGRIARACLTYFAYRYGMEPFALERPQGEYLEANRVWLERRRLEPFMDFLRPLWRRRAADTQGAE
jgi:fido (protein-threonine AMPylation protein)